MKYIRLYETNAEFLSEKDTLVRPYVAYSEDTEGVSYGNNIGIFTIGYEFDGTNNKLCGGLAYDAISKLYVDGAVYDLDNLIIEAGSGSGSGGSGSGSGGSGSGEGGYEVYMPSTVTGNHIVKFIFDLDEYGLIDMSGYNWFGGCTAIYSIVIPNFVKAINAYTFSSVSGIKYLTINSQSVLSQEHYYPEGDSKRQDLSAGTPAVLYDNLFSCFNGRGVVEKYSPLTYGHIYLYPENLEYVEIGNDVTEIPQRSLSHTGYKPVYLPKTITNIDSYATKTNQIIYSGTMEEFNSITFGNYWNNSVSVTITCNDGTLTK